MYLKSEITEVGRKINNSNEIMKNKLREGNPTHKEKYLKLEMHIIG